MEVLPSGLEAPPHKATFDELLAPPAGDDASAPTGMVVRASASYATRDERFLLKHKEYDRQYAQLYFYRLLQMRAHVEAAARSAWPGIPVVRILSVPEDGEVAVVGTLYKEMALKPSILDEYVKDRSLGQQLGRARFSTPEDRLVLEDEGARVTLCGDACPVGECVTGVVAAVRGRVQPNGDFEVTGCVYAGAPPQPPLPRCEDKYVALVSGLGVSDGEGSPLRLQLLVDYLGGLLGGEGERSGVVGRIARVVVAGGLLKTSSALSQPTAYSSVRQQAAALGPLRDVDMALSELAAAVPVDIMPGAGDPANYTLPQQPLHRCLFPGAAAYSSLQRATNPHDFDVDGVTFLGTSGQNVDDIYRYSDIEDRAAILGKLLQWRHLAPTAPDTLAAYPYYESDPFILESSPHVLFAGGQPAFATGVAEVAGGGSVRLVAIPNFCSTGCVVLLNLSTLACQPIYFDDAMQA
ncbi:DNA polymerase delta small subunit [Chlorella sorokiniana]|uniref:DNA polymerase delta small subunit n=1 Tax=Chlorella sorokiniana TaxID=3076 RepID=A0A2P6TSX7_CHLSO|nr:DNA polymerase delta small subunit [Chlorella sorokiniana]|eukprot:PRW57144.1 DNA polymerase delta small subunit [Chlorella sorokiniana]